MSSSQRDAIDTRRLFFAMLAGLTRCSTCVFHTFLGEQSFRCANVANHAKLLRGRVQHPRDTAQRYDIITIHMSPETCFDLNTFATRWAKFQACKWDWTEIVSQLNNNIIYYISIACLKSFYFNKRLCIILHCYYNYHETIFILKTITVY